MIVVRVLRPEQQSNIGLHIHHQLADGFLVRRGYVKQMRFEIEKPYFGAIMMSQLARAGQKRFVPASDRRPVPVIANQRRDDDPPSFPNRLQHDARHTEYAIVIMGAEREQGLWHYIGW